MNGKKKKEKKEEEETQPTKQKPNQYNHHISRLKEKNHLIICQFIYKEPLTKTLCAFMMETQKPQHRPLLNVIKKASTKQQKPHYIQHHAFCFVCYWQC
jgi:hypothetical protein